jgi:hypothetical protein
MPSPTRPATAATDVERHWISPGRRAAALGEVARGGRRICSSAQPVIERSPVSLRADRGTAARAGAASAVEGGGASAPRARRRRRMPCEDRSRLEGARAKRGPSPFAPSWNPPRNAKEVSESQRLEHTAGTRARVGAPPRKKHASEPPEELPARAHPCTRARPGCGARAQKHASEPPEELPARAHP